jgi:DNA polymerase I
MKLLIIDGHALIFRAYYAFQTANLRNSITNLPSGAVFGYFRMLFKILQDYNPTHAALTFDPGTPLERSKVYEAYKANRNPMPEDLRPQVKEIIDICREIGFKLLQIEGHEADDIIGTLTKKYSNKNNKILIFSGDKDIFQILDENTLMLRGKKGASDFIEIDVNWVIKELGIQPNQVTDYMGIVGDTSDNIPGVKGIGEKGAMKLISEYGSLDEIYKNIENINNPSMKSKLIDSKENAFLSRKLATLKTDLKLDYGINDLELPDYFEPQRVQVFKDRGYNVLHRDLLKESQKKYGIQQIDDKPINDNIDKPSIIEKEIDTDQNILKKYKKITTQQELKDAIKILNEFEVISVDTETTSSSPMLAEILGISLCGEEGSAYYIPLKHPNSFFQSQSLDLEEIKPLIKKLLENPKIGKVGQNIKYDMIVFNKYDIKPNPIVFDTMLASYILHPESRRHNMDDLALDYLNYKTITYEDLVGKGKKKVELYEVDPDRVSEYACEDADITLRLYNKLKKEIVNFDTNKVFEKIEMPLISVLQDMEMYGVSIDKKHFSKISKEFRDKIIDIENQIKKMIGRDFNINSTKELQVVLFDELKLPKQKKTQTGFSTDHKVLEELQGKHPIIDYILDYRKYNKLLNTYIDSLPQILNPKTGKIHTSYNQTVAVTGRLSSTDPNLQNIPIKDTEGKLIRSGFISSSKDFEYLSLDYSQIELRIMAHVSGDTNMINAYKNNLDIHAMTASGLFGVKESEVTPEMRSKAKAINFSVIYGTTAFGLAENMKITRTEAGMFIDKYFYQYPSVKLYMESIYKYALEHGYVETLTGRRRYIPEIKSTKRQELESAKRIAINSPIQGTSADMIKIAMIKIFNKFKDKQFKSKMIMQVHDELVFEVYKDEKEKIFRLAKTEMENVLQLNVPILVSGKFGKNWDEAH